ncbi:hypothetical protein BGZ61DRAFT_53956 [Ilyonectria robusta]|uniref:uncharacterized protein n=1 Tax=Ilyonectria robusta TaxID=1079257 RepID=UPI001E8E77BA|nr:uncharacterized protein BGZ61DRAFT_53956 [Ilyonectria robusta]KAH8686588.1 hypothetical protein BGZ61DRAFT_53956 [Ilyonectria robusta]
MVPPPTVSCCIVLILPYHPSLAPLIILSVWGLLFGEYRASDISHLAFRIWHRIWQLGVGWFGTAQTDQQARRDEASGKGSSSDGTLRVWSVSVIVSPRRPLVFGSLVPWFLGPISSGILRPVTACSRHGPVLTQANPLKPPIRSSHPSTVRPASPSSQCPSVPAVINHRPSSVPHPAFPQISHSTLHLFSPPPPLGLSFSPFASRPPAVACRFFCVVRARSPPQQPERKQNIARLPPLFFLFFTRLPPAAVAHWPAWPTLSVYHHLTKKKPTARLSLRSVGRQRELRHVETQ